MKRGFWMVLVLVGSVGLARELSAQTAPAQNPPVSTPRKPSTPPAQQPAKPAEANPFPEDTNNVPVMPSTGTPAIPDGSGSDSGNAATLPHVPLPADDADPARSPDDPTSGSDNASDSSSSDSRTGLDKVMAGADDDSPAQGRGRRKLAVPGPEHKETAAEDIEVGKYELDRKNWKAALSRYESAMVLSPDEPEIYWGLAESARHLGNLAEARGYYQKVAEYDPDSKHGKESIKALKDPEIANAKATPPASPPK